MQQVLPLICVVVSYYNPRQNAALSAQTELCVLRLLASTGVDVRVIISVGDALPDERLQKLAGDDAHVDYLVSTETLGFAQGYNQGIRYASNHYPHADFIATCASDILVAPEALAILHVGLQKRPEAACTIPYLMYSDYLVQNAGVAYQKDRRCVSMTLNLNLFRKSDLEENGLIPEQFSGYFNDIALLISLTNKKREVWLVDAGRVNHLHRTTVGTGATSANYESDKVTFQRLFPAWAAPGRFAAIRTERMPMRWSLSLFYGLWSRANTAWQARFYVQLHTLAFALERFWIVVISKPTRIAWDKLRYGLQMRIAKIVPRSLKDRLKACR